MRPKFYLKRPYNTKSAIDMVCRFNGKRFKVGVGLTVKTENWSKKKQRLKERVTKGIEMNAYLDKCERTILEIFYQFKKSGTLPSPKFIRKEFGHQVKGVPRGDSFFEFFQKHINQQEPNWQRSTFTDYRRTLITLKEFDKQWENDLHYHTIDLEFYEDFKTYLLKQRNQNLNTFGKRIKVLKTVLNRATEYGLNKNFAYKTNSFKVYNSVADHIYLTTSEVKRMISLKLSSKSYRAVRDLFIIGCITGIRFSDYNKLIKNNVQKMGKHQVLRFRVMKTFQHITIPLHSKVIEILESWDYNIPLYSNGYSNMLLKEIGKLAEINEEVLFIKNTGNSKVEERYNKYELICTHTARRSFATNLYLSGKVQMHEIMKLTGHKKERSFMRYVKATRDIDMNIIESVLL